MRMLVWCLVLILVSTSPLFASHKRVKKAKRNHSCKRYEAAGVLNTPI